MTRYFSFTGEKVDSKRLSTLPEVTQLVSEQGNVTKLVRIQHSASGLLSSTDTSAPPPFCVLVFCSVLFFGHAMQLTGSPFPDQGLNLGYGSESPES